MPPMPDIIFDTNVLSNFSRAGQLGLMRKIYPDSACCSGFVVSEILRGLRQGHHDLEPLAAGIVTGWPRQEEMATTAERQLYAAISISLGDGESSCLALAAHRGYVFACDDRLARNEATRLEVPLTGTVGILNKAVRIGVVGLKEANAILRKMVKAGFYAPVKSITEANVNNES